nr:MAG TPA: hypothetical protein [Bacteriophage sp.]
MPNSTNLYIKPKKIPKAIDGRRLLCYTVTMTDICRIFILITPNVWRI